jgi:hypothetical protein
LDRCPFALDARQERGQAFQVDVEHHPLGQRQHGPDPKDHTPSKTPTDREKLLRSWFAKNRKPGAGR